MLTIIFIIFIISYEFILISRPHPKYIIYIDQSIEEEVSSCQHSVQSYLCYVVYINFGI